MSVVKVETVKCCVENVDSEVHRFFIWTRKISEVILRTGFQKQNSDDEGN